MIHLVTEADNVVPITGARQPNPQLVEALEKALSDAREGKVQGILLATNNDGMHMLQRVGELHAAHTFLMLDRFKFSFLFDKLLLEREIP